MNEEYMMQQLAKIDGLGTRFDKFESKIDNFEERMDRFETKMDKFETRMDKLEFQNEVVLEHLTVLSDMPPRVRNLETDMSEVKADVKVIKAVAIETNRDVRDHEVRITRLEAA